MPVEKFENPVRLRLRARRKRRPAIRRQDALHLGGMKILFQIDGEDVRERRHLTPLSLICSGA
jgi:hypothetical protein